MTGTTEAPPSEPARHPALPHGEHVELPGRGTTFVRHLAGPEGAPTVLLLHGWTASMDLNFFTCFRPLAKHFNVVALDHRGHGRGIRSRRAFRLEDCADDAVALLDVLGIDHVMDMPFNDPDAPIPLTYGHIFRQTEQEYSRHNFDAATTDMLLRHFEDAEAECERLLAFDPNDPNSLLVLTLEGEQRTRPMTSASRPATCSTCWTRAA